MERNYCSVLSATLKEDLFATAPLFQKLLLLEYNHAWPEHPSTDNKIDPEVNQFLDAYITRDASSRLMFIKNNNKSAVKVTLYLVNCRDNDPFMKRLDLDDYGDILSLDLDTLFEQKDETICAEPIYLVCTHGKVDVCCSKFGLPIYKQMLELDHNTWQATHVTGDRFAPNVVQLPYGHYYGWLNIDELDVFYKTLADGHIFMKNYRGRPCHTKGEQAAEFFLRTHLNENNVTALNFLKTECLDENRKAVFFMHLLTGKTYKVTYRAKHSNEKYFMNCKADTPVTVEQFKLELITQHE